MPQYQFTDGVLSTGVAGQFQNTTAIFSITGAGPEPGSGVLYRRRAFQDEWSADGGVTWIQAQLRQKGFQFYIEKDFNGDPAISLLRRAFNRWTYLGEEA